MQYYLNMWLGRQNVNNRFGNVISVQGLYAEKQQKEKIVCSSQLVAIRTE